MRLGTVFEYEDGDESTEESEPPILIGPNDNDD